jgi:gamma-glutamyltranspeptidase/glutathione hydrolase
MRAAIADRFQFLGDPDQVRFDLELLISERRMAARKRRIGLDRTHATARFVEREHGTHHLVTADPEGNVVSLTTTVNRAFGAKLSTLDSAIVLNDELDDFTARADIAPLGLKESPKQPRSRARPVSSMTPTIVVRDGRAVLALGGSGGMAIATNVTQVALSHLVFDHTPEQAVTAPRFYISPQFGFVDLEPGASPEHVKDLEWRGEIVGTARFLSTAVQVVSIDDHGDKRAAADPRKHGSAAVF